MLKKIATAAMLMTAIGASAQFVQYAADLRWDDEVHSYIGVANPIRQAATLTITGYDASGAMAGTMNTDLAIFNRKEWASTDLFNTPGVAWVILESSIELGAYVRFEFTDGKRASIYAMSPVAGHQFFVPHIARDTDLFFTDTTITNVGNGSGTALSQPYLDNLDDEGPERILFTAPVEIPSFGFPRQKTTFRYEELFGDQTALLQWDRIATDDPLAMTGVQHFGKKDNSQFQFASLTLPRSPSTELVFSHVNRDRENFWTGMVLINTSDAILPITIESYLADGTPFQRLRTELEPFQKHQFLINNTNELGLSDIATWFRVTSFENALIGYEIFGSPDDRVMAGLEAAPTPSSMCVLPYTPTTDTLWTGIGVINHDDDVVNVQIGGFDDQGQIVAAYDFIRMEPNRKETFTVESIFGDLATSITWVRVDTHRGEVSAFALIGDRERQLLAGLQGMPNQAVAGTVFMANFEHDDIKTLNAQGWKETRFLNDYEAPHKSFSTERYYEAVNGTTQLAYDTFTEIWGNLVPLESMAYVSPAFEIPNDESDYYLSFFLRLVDPERILNDGRYGAVWREEGSDTWHWFGLTGKYHLSVPLPGTEKWGYRERITAVRYREETHNITEWLPFETTLPDSVKGKRIQIGAYLHQTTPREDFLTRFDTPIMLIDLLRVTAEPLPYRTIVIPENQGTFTHSDAP